jgi:hypothetical protein
MEYKEKYEMALERARVWKEKSGMPADKQGILDDIFPELAESEGEKVRKALIEMVRDRTGDELWVDYNVHKEEVLAWLEKQGEQKPIEWDADDDDKFFFLKARLKDYEDCIIYDEEISEWQKSNVRETTKEFLEWLDSIKERIGG